MLHRDSYRYLIPAGIVSLACGVFGWLGFVTPELLGWPPSTPFLAKAVLFLLGCLPILWGFAFRLHLKSLRVLYTETPVTMYLQIKTEQDSESTGYYACLRSSRQGDVVHRVPVYPPSWPCESLGQAQPALVFIDPVSKKPLVVELDGKRLWSMAL